MIITQLNVYKNILIYISTSFEHTISHFLKNNKGKINCFRNRKKKLILN